MHFAVPIHQIEYLEQWENASRLARDGSYWTQMVADRQRFKDRIERVSETLGRILDFEFRQKIYQERFKNFIRPEQETNTAPVTSGASTTLELSAENSDTAKEQLEPIDACKSHSQSQPKLLRLNNSTKQNKKRRRRRRKKKH